MENSSTSTGDQLGLEIDLNPGPPNRTTKLNKGYIGRSEGEAAVSDLFTSAFKLKGTPFLTGLLRFISKTRQYSAFNLGLIYAQRPGATAVGTVGYWARNGRVVKPEATPMVILRPKGPVCFVYEISDTEGNSLFGDDALDPFRVTGEVGQEAWLRFLAGVAREKMFDVSESNYGWNLAGNVRSLHAPPGSRLSKSRDAQFRIRISSRISANQKAVTLAHELAHVYCGHLGQVPKCWWAPRQLSMSKDAEEFEAEAATWIVATRAGLGTTSAEYLTTHANPTIWGEIDVDAIVRAANRIESLGFPVAER